MTSRVSSVRRLPETRRSGTGEKVTLSTKEKAANKRQQVEFYSLVGEDGKRNRREEDRLFMRDVLGPIMLQIEVLLELKGKLSKKKPGMVFQINGRDFTRSDLTALRDELFSNIKLIRKYRNYANKTLREPKPATQSPQRKPKLAYIPEREDVAETMPFADQKATKAKLVQDKDNNFVPLDDTLINFFAQANEKGLLKDINGKSFNQDMLEGVLGTVATDKILQDLFNLFIAANGLRDPRPSMGGNLVLEYSPNTYGEDQDWNDAEARFMERYRKDIAAIASEPAAELFRETFRTIFADINANAPDKPELSFKNFKATAGWKRLAAYLTTPASTLTEADKELLAALAEDAAADIESFTKEAEAAYKTYAAENATLRSDRAKDSKEFKKLSSKKSK